ncbi:hypothetical protein FSP39_009588 [Pinctada imbricata]|uniref:Flavin-containing monooxygenase n=1 Tax=Pinctada imbricata TaxID=66713 RepID=A0AA89BYT7_PINIB|nr:hypothetical protein FSP39_009588 [Pinctada imbricata]
MERAAKKVAVIGAGASGLPAIKCCLDEGLEPVCFERTDHIGGLWYYTTSAIDGQACVMKSTVINTSKEMMCYSDFPIPKEYPNYMHNTYVVKYFNLYADHFDLKKHIRFKTEVMHVKKSSDFASSGQWSIQVKDRDTGQTEDLLFDAVMICTGHHAEKNMPNFPGVDDFKGKVVHSHDYKDFHGYEDKRVVVVGIGNSGGDASVELSRVASQHPTINDDLPNRIISGSIKVKPNIKNFTETGVVFEDGTKEDVDAVVFATGYIFGFPFLDKSVMEVKQNKINLYKYMFPPDLEKNTLCVIGCIQPIGAIMPISENQSRLFTRVVKGAVSLPSSSEMWSDIHSKSYNMAKQYVKSSRHTIQVDYVEFMDEIAEMAGHRPNLHALILRDPKLALKCLLQGCTPYQYRLMGPNSWKGARDAIMTQMDRVHYPLKTRPLGFEEENAKGNFFLLYLVLVIVLAYVMYGLL